MFCYDIYVEEKLFQLLGFVSENIPIAMMILSISWDWHLLWNNNKQSMEIFLVHPPQGMNTNEWMLRCRYLRMPWMLCFQISIYAQKRKKFFRRWILDQHWDFRKLPNTKHKQTKLDWTDDGNINQVHSNFGQNAVFKVFIACYAKYVKCKHIYRKKPLI